MITASTLQMDSFHQTVGRVRYPDGEYVDGRYVKGVEVIEQIEVKSVQPYYGNKADELINTEAGQITVDQITLFCLPGLFRTANDKNNTQADLIEFNGFRYEVQAINYWSGQILTHQEVIGTRVDNP